MPATKIAINLLSEYGINTKPLGKFLKWSLTYGRYIIIGTQIIVLLAFFSRFKLDQELSDLHTHIDEKTNIIYALSNIETNVRTIQTRVGTLKELESGRTNYIDAITFLQKANPRGVSITALIFDEQVMNLTGEASDEKGFSLLLDKIKSNPLFSKIAVDDISQSGDDVISFRIHMDIGAVPKSQVDNSNSSESN